MKGNLLLVIFTLLSFSVFAQITVEQNDFAIDFDSKDNYDVKTDVVVMNGDAGTESFIWNVEVVESTEGWNFFVCDLNKCYGPGFAAIDQDAQNTLTASEEGTMNFHLQPNATPGTGVYKLHLTNPADDTDIIQTVTFTYNSVVDVTDEELAAINIYPNPVTDYFQLENPNNLVSSIHIFDILGKQAMNFKVEGQSSFDVSTLHTGRYFARIYDDEGQSLKVVRLIKN